MYNVTHMYLPNKRSSLLLLHSRIPLIEYARVNTVNHCIREYIFVFATLYRDTYRIRHKFGVFVPALLGSDVIMGRAVASGLEHRTGDRVVLG